MSDAWLPWAIKKPIAPGANDPQITPVMFVAHRAASRGDSLYAWFSGPSGGIESHGYTRRDGTSEQYRAFNYEADAQSAGNSWLVDGRRLGAISWETEGTGTDDWTDAQVTELGRILTFVHDQWGIRLDVVDSPQPQTLAAGGVGWHSKYVAWNPSSHNCPGDANVAKLRTLLASLGDDVALTDADKTDIAKAVWAELGTHTDWFQNRARIAVDAELTERLPDVAAAVVAALPAGSSVDTAAVVEALKAWFARP